MGPGASWLVHAALQIGAAVPCFLLAHRLYQTWTDPASLDAGVWINFGVAVFWLEFVVLHSGVIMASAAARMKTRAKRLACFAAFAAVYSIYPIVIALALGTLDPLPMFGLVLLGRFVALIFEAETGRWGGELPGRSIFGVLVYMLMFVLADKISWPRRGLTEQVIAEHWRGQAKGDDVHAIIAVAVIYFTLMGVFELCLALRPPRRGEEPARPG